MDFQTSKDENDAWRETRVLPEGEDPKMGLVIFDDTVNLFSPREEDYGIQIKSLAFAGLMRYLFTDLWERSGAERPLQSD